MLARLARWSLMASVPGTLCIIVFRELPVGYRFSMMMIPMGLSWLLCWLLYSPLWSSNLFLDSRLGRPGLAVLWLLALPAACVFLALAGYQIRYPEGGHVLSQAAQNVVMVVLLPSMLAALVTSSYRVKLDSILN